VKEIFTQIIKNGTWSTHPCGPGSTMKYTKGLRKELLPLVERHGFKSILDLSCGDYSWMHATGISEKIQYIGSDIVDNMIDENRKKYPGIDFRVLDLTKDKLPDADLLFCRDCLLHLSFSDIDKAFKNIAKSNIKYILLSNWFADSAENTRDIKTGDYRFINFQEHPYSFGKQLDEITDTIPGYVKRKMLLWEVDKTIKPYVERTLI
jgi:SAM-dependent methyltransferase